jgi:protein-S-isoprenylcysteine O-methyltransferase Ste14
MNLKIASSAIMAIGAVLFIAGVGVAYSQPSTPFTLSWWMMIGGWGIAMVGIGLHVYRAFKLLKEKSSPPPI